MTAKAFMVLLLGSVLLPTDAAAASFDCVKARSAVERIICAQASISALDDELNVAYKRVATNADQAALRSDQLLWIAERNRCEIPACIESAYRTRLKALELWATDDPNPSDVSGLYSVRRTHDVYDSEKGRDEPVGASDCLLLKQTGADELKFDFVLIHRNFHTCDMSGVATRVDASTYVYQETVDTWGNEKLDQCTLKITFKRGFVGLGAQGCDLAHCGTGSTIDGAFPRVRQPGTECQKWQQWLTGGGSK